MKQKASIWWKGTLYARAQHTLTQLWLGPAIKVMERITFFHILSKFYDADLKIVLSLHKTRNQIVNSSFFCQWVAVGMLTVKTFKTFAFDSFFVIFIDSWVQNLSFIQLQSNTFVQSTKDVTQYFKDFSKPPNPLGTIVIWMCQCVVTKSFNPLKNVTLLLDSTNRRNLKLKLGSGM